MAKKTTTPPPTLAIDIGIGEPDRQEIAEGLSKLLADTWLTDKSWFQEAERLTVQ